MVASLHTMTHSRPEMRPMPVMMPAPWIASSYLPVGAGGDNARSGAPGSISRSTRSRGSNLPRAAWRSRARCGPPSAASARLSSSSFTSARMAAALARNSLPCVPITEPSFATRSSSDSADHYGAARHRRECAFMELHILARSETGRELCPQACVGPATEAWASGDLRRGSMKRTLLMSVAALALAAGTTVALSQGSGTAGQGAGGNTPMANPSAPSGGQDTKGTKQKGAQERAPAEKQKSTQQQPSPEKKSTSGQAHEDKSKPSTTQQSQDTKSSQPTTKQSQDTKSSTPPSTSGQQTQQKSGTTPSTTQQSQENKSGTGSSSTTSQAPTGATPRQGTAQSTTSGGSSVSLTTAQKTKIRTTVLTSSAPRVSTVNFDVKVGTVVPRSVRVVPVPATIVEIEPQWRGYMYFVYRDEIIIVEPNSLRIVAVLLV